MPGFRSRRNQVEVVKEDCPVQLEDGHTDVPEGMRHTTKAHDRRTSTKGEDLALKSLRLHRHRIKDTNVGIIQCIT